MTLEDSRFDTTVENLISAVMEHVRLEENDELPRLQQQLSDEDVNEIGEEMERFKANRA